MTLLSQKLKQLSDQKHIDFTKKITPTIDRQKILGVKTPILKSLAKTYYGTEIAEAFLKSLPHYYLEENNLHAHIINNEKDFNKAISLLNDFLPFVDNWATCDALSPYPFKKYPHLAKEYILIWLKSTHPFTVRFAIGMFLKFYLDQNFTPDILEAVAKINSDEYYVNMMIAWFFATAISKQYESAVCYIEAKRLSPFCHNMTIQKARESFRVSQDIKQYLLTLKI